MPLSLSIRRARKRERQINDCLARARYAEGKAQAAQNPADR